MTVFRQTSFVKMSRTIKMQMIHTCRWQMCPNYTRVVKNDVTKAIHSIIIDIFESYFLLSRCLSIQLVHMILYGT